MPVLAVRIMPIISKLEPPIDPAGARPFGIDIHA
jgi:hypothetical protein